MINFDIENTPPTTEQIVAERKYHSTVLKQVVRREKHIKQLLFVLGLFLFGAALVMWWLGYDLVAGGFLGAFAGAFAGLAFAVFVGLAFANAFAVERFIKTPRDNSISSMKGLIDLDFSENQDECIQFDAWRVQDDTIKQYSNALAAMNRKPVLAEYALAKNWIANEAQRLAQSEKETRARQACDRMAQVV